MTDLLGNKTFIIVMTVILIAVILFYYFVDPAQVSFVPRCPFKLLTGWDCPSCGAQRAFHAFLHGDIAGGIRHNFFLLIGLPYLACAIVGQAINRPWAHWIRRHILTQQVAFVYLALFCAWWVVRNLI